MNCVLKGGLRDTFSAQSILKKIGWPSSKEHLRVRYCRNAERHFLTRERKGRSLRKNDRNQNALLVSICISSQISIVKKHNEFQHGACTKMFTQSVWRAKNSRMRSSKQTPLLELCHAERDERFASCPLIKKMRKENGYSHEWKAER